MALSLDSIIKYIPKYNNERKRYEKGENEAPLTFHIQVMGAVPFRSFAAKLAKAAEKDGEGDLNDQVVALYREVICGHVKKIENLTVDGQPIEDGASFYDHPAMPHDLVLEIERAIVDVNTVSEEEAKN